MVGEGGEGGRGVIAYSSCASSLSRLLQCG